MVFPYSFASILDIREVGGFGVSARAMLLAEILGYMGYSGGGMPVPAPDHRPARFAVHAASPNPFNPNTTIVFEAPHPGSLVVKVFDLRGRQVATVFDGPVDGGPGSVAWRGLDTDGRPVSSGVYIFEVTGFGEAHRQKVALLR
jgi:hypothetical protein